MPLATAGVKRVYPTAKERYPFSERVYYVQASLESDQQIRGPFLGAHAACGSLSLSIPLLRIEQRLQIVDTCSRAQHQFVITDGVAAVPDST
jgi:hypothetical protein